MFEAHRDKKGNFSASILIVEDNKPAAMAVQIALDSFHCHTDIAHNGDQAVKMAESSDYDLILMDIGLPDFSGVEATRRIRRLSEPKKSKVPIVALTGHANNPEMRQEALDAGMQEVLSKPAKPLTLESVLKNYVFKIKKESKRQNQISQETVRPINTLESSEVIDWNACVRMNTGNPNFATKMLSMLAEDLKDTKATLAKAYANRDTKALRAELHRARGGVCYLKLPQLEQALKEFHKAVKADPQNQEELETTYAALQHAMDTFWKTWESSDFNQ